MTARYDLTMTIWAISIFSADLDEQVEYWLNDALYYDLQNLIDDVSELDEEVAKKLKRLVDNNEIEANDILTACEYKEEDITLKAFREDKIQLNIPLYINIERLRKVVE